MTQARREQVSVEATPYYHVMSRCVRRAFLCGEDRFSGQCFDHRKQWIVDRMKELSAVFAIDTCAYAVMSNHVHLVLRLVPERAEAWDEDALLERVGALFKPTAQALRELPAKARRKALLEWRQRLGDLSWFMRCLNEQIARRANREDRCTGRFWEGRFKSQALLDEGALLTCMSYVDLNPVRAGLATRLEDCDLTSIQERLFLAAGAENRAACDLRADGADRRVASKLNDDPAESAVERDTACDVRAEDVDGHGRVAGTHNAGADPVPAAVDDASKATSNDHRPERPQASLVPMRGERSRGRGVERPSPLPIRLEDYVALLEYGGQAPRADGKRGKLPDGPSSALARLGLDPDRFAEELAGFGRSFYAMVGASERLHLEKQRLGRQHVKGIRAAERLYRTAA